MKYIFQFCILMIFVLLGEVCEHFIPLPIAGSIYGLVLLFLALVFGVVKLHWVEDVANWFHNTMSLFFVAPAVAVIDIWGDIADIWWILVLLMVSAYLVTMIMTGITADALIHDSEKKRGRKK
ncbi:MAG: CidA/LrgA family protein [Alphaproteobacteria bacterium]|nr:CidA/LrgA family protein [Alphaproteobacteria bacterium]